MITNEMKAKIFALYYGSDCQSIEPETNKVCIHRVYWKLFEYISDPTLQLILTPLSEITDEDAIAVADIVMRPHNRHYAKGEITYKYEPYKQTIPEIGVYAHGKPRFTVRIEPAEILLFDHNDNPFKQLHNYHVSNQYEAVDFLRAKTYMVNCMGIDLFESGIAIPKPKK